MKNVRAISALATSALLILAGTPSSATPTYTAKATLTAPTGSAPYTTQNTSGGLVAMISIQSTNQSVAISGGTAYQIINVQLDMNVNAGAFVQDDFYSGLIRLSNIEEFYHSANNTGSMSGTDYKHAGSYTAHAISDIYDVNNTSQKAHVDSSANFTVVNP